MHSIDRYIFFDLSTNAIVMIGRIIKKNVGGFAKPMSGLNGSNLMMYIHHELTVSKQITKNPSGMYSNSQKKTIVERRRKVVMKGVKIRFPSGETREMGSPQLIRIGKDISEIKS